MARTRAVTPQEQYEAAGEKIVKDFTKNTIMVLMPVDLYKTILLQAEERGVQPVDFLREAVTSYIGAKDPV